MPPTCTHQHHSLAPWRPTLFAPARSTGARTTTLAYGATHPSPLSAPLPCMACCRSATHKLPSPASMLPTASSQPATPFILHITSSSYAVCFRVAWQQASHLCPVANRMAVAYWHPRCACSRSIYPQLRTHRPMDTGSNHTNRGTQPRKAPTIDLAFGCVGACVVLQGRLSAWVICPPVRGARVRLCCHRPCCRPCNQCRS